MQQEKLLTIPEYAEECGVERTTIYRWIKSGKVETAKERGKLRVVVQEEAPQEDVAAAEENAAEVVALLQRQLTEKDEQIKVLLEQVMNLQESIQQQNAIVMQMTRNTEVAHRLIEYHEKPFWRRVFRRRSVASSAIVEH